MKKKWYYSDIRFYFLNLIWNYKFWLFSKKVYDNKTFTVNNEEKKLKKFAGYLYKNKIYLDNPGFPIRDRDLWKVWKKKGFIK